MLHCFKDHIVNYDLFARNLTPPLDLQLKNNSQGSPQRHLCRGNDSAYSHVDSLRVAVAPTSSTVLSFDDSCKIMAWVYEKAL